MAAENGLKTIQSPNGQQSYLNEDSSELIRTVIENPEITTVRQKQSMSYLSVSNERSSRTISRKLSQAKTLDLVKVKSFKTIALSNIVDGHIRNPEANYVMLNSEVRSEAYEMKKNIQSRFPILTRDAFVSSNKEGNHFSVLQTPANIITYTEVNKNCKLNRRVFIKIKKITPLVQEIPSHWIKNEVLDLPF
jgi:hypothetical protein